jgi:Bax protein
MQAGRAPDYWQRHQLKMWAERYDLKFKDNKLETLAKKLLLHLDQIPTSMVLAQAAIESAWGTSRFVQIGNNFFGQWCFKKGCGMIPAARSEDAKHEVKNFDSPEESIATYFGNINKHAAYKELRELRAQARKEGKPLSGLELVAGLENYSQRGEDYVEELRSVIRSNHFE